MLYIALSSLQGRYQESAYNDILKLEPDGIQLTPGNHPSPNFKNKVIIPYRYHHGFDWDQYKREVYDQSFIPLNIEYDRSIHPPKRNEKINFYSWINQVGDVILEVMYPEYWLGNEKEILCAMECQKRLAIDISHLFIMKTQKTISDDAINKILNYHKITEVHVSQNAGKFDTHRPITKDTPWLGWAREKLQENIPVIYESYFHKLNDYERKLQIDVLRG